jgi:hypothetical protein
MDSVWFRSILFPWFIYFQIDAVQHLKWGYRQAVSILSVSVKDFLGLEQPYYYSNLAEKAVLKVDGEYFIDPDSLDDTLVAYQGSVACIPARGELLTVHACHVFPIPMEEVSFRTSGHFQFRQIISVAYSKIVSILVKFGILLLSWPSAYKEPVLPRAERRKYHVISMTLYEMGQDIVFLSLRADNPLIVCILDCFHCWMHYSVRDFEQTWCREGCLRWEHPHARTSGWSYCITTGIEIVTVAVSDSITSFTPPLRHLTTNKIINFDLKIRPPGGQNRRFWKTSISVSRGHIWGICFQQLHRTPDWIIRTFACCDWKRYRYFRCVFRFRLDGRYISADVYSFGLAWSKELSASRT